MLDNYIGREQKRQAPHGTVDPALALIPPVGGQEINEREKSKEFKGFKEFEEFEFWGTEEQILSSGR